MKLMKILKNKLLNSNFNKSVLKVFTGSTLAALIPLVVLPILTRIYSAEAFGNFQLLLSIVTLLMSVGSMQFQLAIVLPKSKKESDNLFILSILILLIVTFLFSLILWYGSEVILPLFNAQHLQSYLYLVSIGVFLGGLIQAVRYLLVRSQRYTDLAKTHVSHQIFTQGASLSIGFFYPSFISLFLCHIGGFLVATLIAMRNQKFSYTKEISFKFLIKKYKKFPLINTPMVFLNDFSLQLPVFMISAFYSPELVGIYMLSHRIAYKPMSLISSSFAQVYFKEASTAFNKSKEALLRIYKNTVKKLTLMGILFILAINFVVAPSIGIIFGDEWEKTGIFIHILSFWFFFQFINSPISKTLSIINKQEFGLLIISVSIVVRFLVMLVFKDTINGMLWGLSISAGLFYLVYNINIYRLIKRMSI
ncbi:lipopolysaccharide biosynthesis protein [Gracilibacillus sp. D59]|uniref:lipopolysaccharide biosynthesis protein n=1 Tax=Gracilibacillus sp. D59 TaxID=3457434 RepID=UPI003FCE09E6